MTMISEYRAAIDDLEHFRLKIDIIVRQINQPPWVVARQLVLMTKAGRIKTWPCTDAQAVASLMKLEAAYAPHLHAPRTVHWTDSDGLSTLRLCQQCSQELYAPLVLEYCPLCENCLSDTVV